MRVSVTDRCNLRCRYCMPRGIVTVPMTDILTYEEILDTAWAAARCGIKKLKVTGGEPLVRKGVIGLIQKLKEIPGIEQVTLTTNGTLLAPCVNELKAAGLDGVNVSLDTLNARTFREITGFDLLNDVLCGIDAALSAGLRVKVNAVLQEGVNAEEWDALLQMAGDSPLDVRFIEMMPIGEARRVRAVNNHRLLGRVREKYPKLEADTRSHGNGPAVYVRIPGFQGSVGFISAMNEKFCGSCNRIRLTARGELKPCLCYADSVDLRRILRETAPEGRIEKLAAAIRSVIEMKPRAHCFEDERQITEPRRMAEIGG